MSILYPGSAWLDFLDTLTFVPFFYLSAFVWPDRLNNFVAAVYITLHLAQAVYAAHVTAPQKRATQALGYIEQNEGRLMYMLSSIIFAFADVPLLVTAIIFARDSWWAASKTFLAISIVSVVVTTARMLRIRRSTLESVRSKSARQAALAAENF